MAGSDFELQRVSPADIKAAKDFFLRFSGERVLDHTPHGQILERGAGRDARIYVTGLSSRKKSGLRSPITLLR